MARKQVGICLDAGCGDGKIAFGLKDFSNEIIAVDLSKEKISLAKNAGKHTQVSFLVADLEKLPFSESVFDCIICAEVIEHIKDENRLLEEFKRTLRREGFLVLTTPNRNRWQARLTGRINVEAGHLREYGEYEIVELLEKNQFEIADILCDCVYPLMFLPVPKNQFAQSFIVLCMNSYVRRKERKHN